MIQNKIAGALFDFMGHLTTQAEPITVGSSHEVYKLQESFVAWAKSRNLNIDNPDIENWNKGETVEVIEPEKVCLYCNLYPCACDAPY